MLPIQLSDAELVSAFQDIVIEEQEKLALQLEYLVELDRRKLFFHYTSLRAYLVAEHGMEEWQAERRIRAARMLKRFPSVKTKLETGRLNLTLLEIAQGCAHREKLSDPEFEEILDAISGLSCRAAMKEIATRYPHSAELPRDRIRPLTGDLSEVRFVATDDLIEKLDEIRGLVAHAHPKLTMAELIDLLATDYRARHHPEEKAKRAMERKRRSETVEMATAPWAHKSGDQSEKIEEPAAPWVQDMNNQSEPAERAAAQWVQESHNRSETVETPTAPRPQERDDQRVPSAAMIHALIERDGYECSYLDPITTKKCSSHHALEIDHEIPWCQGGQTVLSNLRYRCVQHHRRISFLQFGESSRFFKVSAFAFPAKKS